MPQISKSQCIELKSNPGFYLQSDAAKAWDRACAAFGKVVLLTGAWRSYEIQERLFDGEKFPNQDPQYGRYLRGNRAGQRGFTNDVRWWSAKGSYWTRKEGSAAAAVPGTSNHGGGIAVDVKTRREAGDPPYDVAVIFGSWTDADRTRFLRVAAEHGWDDDEGRSVNELWHLTYYPSRDQHRGQTAPSGSIPTPEEEFLMALPEKDQKAMAEAIQVIKGVLTRKLADGDGATTPDQIWRRDLIVDRRTDNNVKALRTEMRALRTTVDVLVKSLAGVDAEKVYALLDKNLQEAMADLKITFSTEESE